MTGASQDEPVVFRLASIRGKGWTRGSVDHFVRTSATAIAGDSFRLTVRATLRNATSRRSGSPQSEWVCAREFEIAGSTAGPALGSPGSSGCQAAFPRRPQPVTEMVSPMKPLEAMSMEKAVVVSSVAALSVSLARCGYLLGSIGLSTLLILGGMPSASAEDHPSSVPHLTVERLNAVIHSRDLWRENPQEVSSELCPRVTEAALRALDRVPGIEVREVNQDGVNSQNAFLTLRYVRHELLSLSSVILFIIYRPDSGDCTASLSLSTL